jgi:hypothetical protein
MSDDIYNYDEHKQEAAGPGDNILASLSALAMEQKRAEVAVAKAEEALALANAELKRISEHVIPDLMDVAKLTEYTSRDGIKIKIGEKIRGSIPKANEEKAFAWLTDQKHDDLIKREFKIQFGKNEEGWAKKFLADLQKRKRPLAFELKRTVHASTLASFVKGQLESGVDFPMDIFGVYRQRASTIEVKD